MKQITYSEGEKEQQEEGPYNSPTEGGVMLEGGKMLGIFLWNCITLFCCCCFYSFDNMRWMTLSPF